MRKEGSRIWPKILIWGEYHCYTTAVLHSLECRDGSVTFFISTRGREGGD